MPLPDDFIPDGVEHTRGLKSVYQAPPATLEKRRGLGLSARIVATGKPGYPAIPSRISRNRERALRWQLEKVSPGRFEMGVR